MTNDMNVFLDPENIPILKKFPCRGCVFLEPVYHQGQNGPSKSYMKCTFQPEPTPRAFWQYHVPYSEPAQWRNIKYIDGPFAEDAEDVICEVRKEKIEND